MEASEQSRDLTSRRSFLLKGAAVGLVIVALCAGECEAEYVLRGTLGYAAIGGAIDALQGNNKTIYQRQPGAAVAWRVRF